MFLGKSEISLNSGWKCSLSQWTERRQSVLNSICPALLLWYENKSHKAPHRQMVVNEDAAKDAELLVPSRMHILVFFFCIHKPLASGRDHLRPWRPWSRLHVLVPSCIILSIKLYPHPIKLTVAVHFSDSNLTGIIRLFHPYVIAITTFRMSTIVKL